MNATGRLAEVCGDCVDLSAGTAIMGLCENAKSMTDRYFLPQLQSADEVELKGRELHHLARVMRLRTGDRVVVFDGTGVDADAEIVTLTNSKATLRIVQRRQGDIERATEIVLATAVPKADRFRWLVEKATELGVDRLIPLHTQWSVAEPRETRLEKMRLAVVEACKQSGRNRLMSIDAAMPWEHFVQNVVPTMTALLADPKGALANVLQSLDRADQILLIVGPEGGFTETELRQAVDAGADLVALGRGILRIETAALAFAAAVALHPVCARQSEVD